MSKVIKISILIILILIISSMLWVDFNYDEVCVPLYVDLDTNKYLILKEDTLNSGRMKFKRVLFIEK